MKIDWNDAAFQLIRSQERTSMSGPGVAHRLIVSRGAVGRSKPPSSDHRPCKRLHVSWLLVPAPGLAEEPSLLPHARFSVIPVDRSPSLPRVALAQRSASTSHAAPSPRHARPAATRYSKHVTVHRASRMRTSRISLIDGVASLRNGLRDVILLALGFGMPRVLS